MKYVRGLFILYVYRAIKIDSTQLLGKEYRVSDGTTFTRHEQSINGEISIHARIEKGLLDYN